MKKARLLLATGLLACGLSFTSFAAGFDANASYVSRLQVKLEENKEKLEESNELLIELQEDYDNMKPYYEKMTELYEKELTKGSDMDWAFVYGGYDKIKKEFKQLERDLNAEKRANEDYVSSIEAIEEQLSSITDRSVAWNGQMSEEDENDEIGKLTYQFNLEKKDGTWYLTSKYRSWNNAHGGSWSYNPLIRDDIDLTFCDTNGDVLIDELDRAEEMDTETHLVWEVDEDLVANEKYYIEFNGNTYGLYARDNTNKSVRDKGQNESVYVDSKDFSYNVDENMVTNQSDTTSSFEESNTLNVNGVMVHQINDLPSYIDDGHGTWYQDMNAKWHFRKSNGIDSMNEYVFVNGRWYTMGSDGVMYDNAWIKTTSGATYFCDENGALVTGWKLISDKWYYFNSDTSLKLGGTTPDGYIVDNNGVWIQ